MTLEQLKSQRTTLILQRSAAKDAVENAERALQAINLAIQVLEKNEASRTAADKPPAE